MPSQTHKLIISVAILLTLLGVAFFGIRQATWREDFSRWPPERVFVMVLGEPPAGVSRIQASGRHYFIKRWVLLRVEGNSSALASLEAVAKRGGPLTRTELQERMWGSLPANNPYDATDQRRVGWQGVTRIKNPVCYEYFRGDNDPWLWHCLFIFDHANGAVYIQADGG